jgi:UDP-glucose 4-epimerase
MAARRALVTGGAGFIGSHVADLYQEQGYDVTVLDNLSSGRRENVPAGRTFHELDITSADAAALVREGKFDVISHLAAQIDVRKSTIDPTYDARINILGTVNLIQAVKDAGRPARFIFSSTGGAIYGDFVTPPNVETMPKDPESPYGIAKLSAELYLASFARLYKIDTVALRYANVYGPRQDPHGEAGVVAIFCNRVIDGKPLTVFGDGKQTRDYVFVKDVARANLAAAERDLPPMAQLDSRAFNVGTGVETSVVELAEIIMRAAGAEAALNFAAARPGELQRSAVSIEKAGRVLGWRPKTALQEGLAETFAWFAARRRSSQPA